MDLAITDVRLRDRSGLVTVGIDDGQIAEIDPSTEPDADRAVSGDGGLLTPSFVNPHIHLDQISTWTADPNESGTIEEAFEINRRVKAAYEVDEIVERAGPAIEEAVRHGNTLMRGFVDVDGDAGLTGLVALLELADEYDDLADIETVAFAQEGLGTEKHPEGEAILREGMERGADVVGGIPWIEYGDAEVRAHVDTVFDIADEYDADIHFLVDDTDTPVSRALEYVALKTIREGYEGRVACSHARALAAYDDYHAAQVIDLVRKADLQILSNTHIVLFLGGSLDPHPRRRGITRIDELVEAGVNVCIGQDDVNDMYYPFGRNDMLELAWFACHAAQFSSESAIEAAYDMVTVNAARAMGRTDHGLAVGSPADMVILDASSVQEALRTNAACRYVFKDGRIVAETETESRIVRSPPD